MISGFNTEREVAQLKIAQEYHESQIDRIERRIEELEELAEKKDQAITSRSPPLPIADIESVGSVTI